MHCLFCGSDKTRKALFPRPTSFNNKTFNYYNCEDCNLVFIHPLPAEDDYARMYAKEYHQQFYFNDNNTDYTEFYTLLQKQDVQRTILDYGCGDGSFLNYFSKKGYVCTGVEYDKELVKILKEKYPGITFYSVEEFNQLDKQIKYGTIYLGDVLEHLSEPSGFIQDLGKKLTANGLILVQGPLENNFTLGLLYRKIISWFRSGKLAYHVPYHISFSNAKNQKRIFEKNGFKTVYYKIYETPWPFPNKFEFKPVAGLHWLIARTSVLFSKILPGKAGNRFIYLGILS